jgi:hypothetical protein
MLLLPQPLFEVMHVMSWLCDSRRERASGWIGGENGHGAIQTLNLNLNLSPNRTGILAQNVPTATGQVPPFRSGRCSEGKITGLKESSFIDR